MPAVSVVIPLYNKSPYIARALNSVLAQSFQDFEVIVVNDGSTDGGEEIVSAYNDIRIHLINQKNQGVSAARNHGIDAARAELIAFLDADDEWLPEYLNTILRLRKKYPEAGMYTTARYSIYPDGSKSVSHCSGIPNNWEGIIPSVFKSAALDGSFPGVTSSTAVPKKVLTKIGFFPEGVSMSEDTDTWGKIGLYYKNAHSSKPLAIYYKDVPTAATANSVIVLALQNGHPFQNTIDQMPVDIVQNLHDYKDLMLYLDRLNIVVAYKLIEFNHNRYGRRFLMKVTHHELLKQRTMMYIYSYIPNQLRPYISHIIRKMNYIRYCLNFSVS